MLRVAWVSLGGSEIPPPLVSRPVASLLITEGRFPQISDLLQGFKIGFPSGCLGETSIFKMIMIDDVTLWSKLESTW